MKATTTKSEKQKTNTRTPHPRPQYQPRLVPAEQQTIAPSPTPLTQLLNPRPQLPSERPSLIPEPHPSVQRMDMEEDDLLQGKFAPIQKMDMEEEELLQGKFAPLQRQENRTGLPDNLKSGIETLSGLDMSDIRVHYNSTKPTQLNALAYAQGSDIHIGPGQEKHLPHEAWHTVQQRQGRVKPTMMLGKTQINDDVGLEREADVMGNKAFQLVDKSSEVIAQRKLQEMANSGPQVKQLRAIPEMMDNSRQTKQTAQSQALTSNHSIRQWQVPKASDEKASESLSRQFHELQRRPIAHATAQFVDQHLEHIVQQKLQQSIAEKELAAQTKSATDPALVASLLGGPPVQFSWDRLLRSGIRSAGALAGAWGGTQVGAAVGSFLGPWGILGGSVIGGLGGAILGYGGTAAVINVPQVRSLEQRMRAFESANKPTRTTWQAWTDQRLEELDTMEHEVYQWLHENRGIPGADTFKARILGLMDRIQTEHRTVIDEVHQHNLNLWTPDRASLGGVDVGNLQTAWNRLRNGDPRMVIPGGNTNAASELRAMHARLLSRPTGRRLLMTHLDMDPLGTGDVANKNINIKFTPPDNRDPAQKAYVEELRRQLRNTRAQLQGMAPTDERYDERYDALIGQQMNLRGKIDIAGGESDAAAASPVSGRDASIGGTGQGSHSNVSVREGTRDSDDANKDWYGLSIPAPAFIQYGHELIHALHFRNAQDRRMEDYDRYRGTRWTDREEHQTIESLYPGAISENMLREEHGITKRWGHG